MLLTHSPSGTHSSVTRSMRHWGVSHSPAGAPPSPPLLPPVLLAPPVLEPPVPVLPASPGAPASVLGAPASVLGAPPVPLLPPVLVSPASPVLPASVDARPPVVDLPPVLASPASPPLSGSPSASSPQPGMVAENAATMVRRLRLSRILMLVISSSLEVLRISRHNDARPRSKRRLGSVAVRAGSRVVTRHIADFFRSGFRKRHDQPGAQLRNGVPGWDPGNFRAGQARSSR